MERYRNQPLKNKLKVVVQHWLFQYKYQGRHTEAINAWQNATQISPTYTGAWKHTLMLLHDLGKK